MISCIEWIPRNVADPNPKKYELSSAEREVLAQEEYESMNQNLNEDSDDEQISDSIQEEIKNVSVPKEGKPLTASEIIASQKIDPSTLPKELRMDDYSDDEDGDKDNNGVPSSGNNNDIGNLLIGNDDAGMMGIDEDGKVEDIDIDGDSDSDSDDDDSDDDDFTDIPDTREFIPNDVKGLEAMNFGGYTGMNEFDEGENTDDDSDVEDTNLKPDDALIVVAKTEEVRYYHIFGS